MNDENKIGLSIEMYEDLKETLVKAVKSTKANAGLENAQLERIERLIEATEALAGAGRTDARTTATAYGLAGSKNRAGAGIYRQIQRSVGAVSG